LVHDVHLVKAAVIEVFILAPTELFDE